MDKRGKTTEDKKGLLNLIEQPHIPISLMPFHPLSILKVPWPDQQTRHKASEISWNEYIGIAEKYGPAGMESRLRYLKAMFKQAEVKLKEVGAFIVKGYNALFPNLSVDEIEKALNQGSEGCKILVDRILHLTDPNRRNRLDPATAELAEQLRRAILFSWGELFSAYGLLQHRLYVLSLVQWRVAVFGDYRRQEELFEKEKEELYGSSPGRPYDFPIEKTKRWYQELSEQSEYQGRGSLSRIIKEIEKRHEVDAGFEPGETTIRDQVRKIRKGDKGIKGDN